MDVITFRKLCRWCPHRPRKTCGTRSEDCALDRGGVGNRERERFARNKISTISGRWVSERLLPASNFTAFGADPPRTKVIFMQLLSENNGLRVLHAPLSREKVFMWIVAIVLWSIFGGAAWAFDCSGVKLPSSIVICSDPELMRLADERQEAMFEARARVGDDRFSELWEDQKVWVRSYAAACGVPPDRLPPISVPASVKACFKRAGEARLAYIQRFGVGTGTAPLPMPLGSPAPLDRIGPSFDCSKAATPLALMICADADLTRVDFRFNQAYWALFQYLGPARQPQLKAEDIQFIEQVQLQCGVPTSGPLTAETRQALDCVRNAYEKERQGWLARLAGPAYEEAVRTPERHLALQKALQQLGFLAPGPIDGVYGRATRSAIAAWQSARGLAVTGLFGDVDARLIEREAAVGPLPDRGQSGLALSTGEVIPLKNGGGVYEVGVRINRAITLDFIVDSGASDVLIPADVAMTLARAGTISSSDFIGNQEYRIGDGSTLKSERFILRELGIGGRIVQNVVASIGSVKGEPLLGQSFLARFGSWSIDNSRHVLVLGELVQ
jgi:uncharacterized protein/predicted aspartyl protease